MAAISIVDICNRALQKLGAKRISSIDDTGSVSARACKLAYNFCRRALLEDHDWGFSILRDSLAADSPAPTWGRQNSFTLPAAFIRLAPGYPEMLTQDANTIGSTVAFTAQFSGYKDWVIEDGKIVTNDQAPLQIRYVNDVTDTTKFTSIFTEALACLMAFEMCEELTQSNTKKGAFSGEVDKKIDRAKFVGDIQVAPADPPPDTWLTARS